MPSPPKSIAINVRVDIPALTDYIAYVRDRDARDDSALALRIKQAATRLRTSTARLKDAAEQTQL